MADAPPRGRVSGARAAATWPLGLLLLVAPGCGGVIAPVRPPSVALEQSRNQTKLEDRLRRLEGKLQRMDAQLGVLREQLREPAAQAARGTKRSSNSAATARALDEAPYAGDTRELTWPQSQRIVTDAAGKVRLVAVAETGDDASASPGSAAVEGNAGAEAATEGERQRARARAARARRAVRNRAN